MLEQVLRRLASGTPLHIEQLAGELDMTPALLQMAMEDLERRGYVQEIAAACESRCAGCAHSGTCSLVGTGRIWSLTDAGRRWVEKAGG